MSESTKSLLAIPAFAVPVILFVGLPLYFFGEKLGEYADKGPWQTVFVAVALFFISLSVGFAGVVIYARKMIKIERQKMQ